jgi:hypothetical protein
MVAEQATANQQSADTNKEPERFGYSGRSRGLKRLRCTLLPSFMALIARTLGKNALICAARRSVSDART